MPERGKRPVFLALMGTLKPWETALRNSEPSGWGWKKQEGHSGLTPESGTCPAPFWRRG